MADLALPDLRLSVHHIGARYGSRYFPVLPNFEPEVVNVLYDADPDCVAQIEEKNAALPSELHVLPYCLAAERGTAELTITFDPFASSLYVQNHAYDSFHVIGTVDYVMGEALRPIETRIVETTTLDDVVRESGGTIPPPDFLSANIQGAEYDVLLGGREALQSRTVGIMLEVELHALYAGQKLFGDVSRLLDDRGFHFVRFAKLFELSPVRLPIGLRGPGFHSFAFAIFLRKLESVASVVDDDHRYVMLRKLGYVALACNQLEYALAALAESRAIDPPPAAATDFARTAIGRFLVELERAAETVPATLPPTFADVHTVESSRARFTPDSARPSSVGRADGRAPLRRLIARLRFEIGTRRRRYRRDRPSRVEELLRANALTQLADEVAARRRAAT
jgi:FkbM family methyltransferase